MHPVTIDDIQAFIDSVNSMREMQRKYFVTRSKHYLKQSIQLEKSVDAQLEHLVTLLDNTNGE